MSQTQEFKRDLSALLEGREDMSREAFENTHGPEFVLARHLDENDQWVTNKATRDAAIAGAVAAALAENAARTVSMRPDKRDSTGVCEAAAVAIYMAVTGKGQHSYCSLPNGESSKWFRAAMAANEAFVPPGSAVYMPASKVAAAPATCRDLTDQDMDKVADWIADLECGDIGYHKFCDNVVALAADRATQEAASKGGA